MGAEIALKFATLHPKRVRSLVMGGSGWSAAPDLQNYLGIGDSLAQGRSFGAFLRAMTPAGEPAPSSEEIASFDELLRGQDIDALVAVARSMGGIIDVSKDAMTAIAVPVLGIAGEHDPERGNLEKMDGVVPDFTMRVLAGRNHMSALSDPQFNTSIVEFLTRTSAGS